MNDSVYKKYIDLLNISDIKEKSNYYNFSCVFCNEGDSLGRKKRGFILKNRNYQYYCHNCNISYSFKNFLYNYDSDLYNQYMSEIKLDIFKFKSKQTRSIENEYIKEYIKPFKINKFIQLNNNFIPANNVPFVREYLLKRKVSESQINQLYFYYKINSTQPFNNSIIFPFYYNDKIYGFQSRNIAMKRFNIFLCDESYPKIFNLFNIDLNKDVYIFEGFFDSIFIENSICLNGADISIEYISQIPNPVFVMDNDKTGYEKMKKYADLNHKIFIYPSDFKYKDFNEFVVKTNCKSIEVAHLIRSNIYEKESAQFQLQLRKQLLRDRIFFD